MEICPKCKTSPVNATGVMCDACMMEGGSVYQLPTEEIKAIEQIPLPTATDVNNDKCDKFTKSFEDGLEIRVVINYTKNYSEISIYKNDVLTDTNTYTDKEVFEKTLNKAIDSIKAQEDERKRVEAERVQYFKDIKGVVGDLGFDTVDDQVDE